MVTIVEVCNSYVRAVVLKPPVVDQYNLVSVLVRLRRLDRKRLQASFINGCADAMSLKPGDEVWVCPANGEIGAVIKHNRLMRLWLRL